jgi:hypothetical protein
MPDAAIESPRSIHPEIGWPGRQLEYRFSQLASLPMIGVMATSGPIHPPAVPGLNTPAIQAALLKEIGKQLVGTVGGDPLRVGQVVNARIAADADGMPMLLLGGVKVPAELPGDVQLGQLLRLQVKESSPERVLLQIIKDPAAAATSAAAATAADLAAAPASQAQGPAQQAAATAVPWAVIPMPGGAQARIWLDPEQQADEAATPGVPRTRSMVVRYDSPVLGRTDVVLRLEPGQLEATVLAASGVPLELVRSSVPELRMALAGAVERPVALTTGGRSPEAFDVRA